MEESWSWFRAVSMVGGAIGSPSGDLVGDTRVLVLNLLWRTRGVTNTGQDIFVLDNAFALIEGQRWPLQTGQRKLIPGR